MCWSVAVQYDCWLSSRIGRDGRDWSVRQLFGRFVLIKMSGCGGKGGGAVVAAVGMSFRILSLFLSFSFLY